MKGSWWEGEWQRERENVTCDTTQKESRRKKSHWRRERGRLAGERKSPERESLRPKSCQAQVVTSQIAHHQPPLWTPRRRAHCWRAIDDGGDSFYRVNDHHEFQRNPREPQLGFSRPMVSLYLSLSFSPLPLSLFKGCTTKCPAAVCKSIPI